MVKLNIPLVKANKNEFQLSEPERSHGFQLSEPERSHGYHTCPFCEAIIPYNPPHDLQILQDHFKVCEGEFTCDMCQEILPLDLSVDSQNPVNPNGPFIDSTGMFKFFIPVCVICFERFETTGTA